MSQTRRSLFVTLGLLQLKVRFRVFVTEGVIRYSPLPLSLNNEMDMVSHNTLVNFLDYRLV